MKNLSIEEQLECWKKIAIMFYGLANAEEPVPHCKELSDMGMALGSICPYCELNNASRKLFNRDFVPGHNNADVTEPIVS